MIQISTYKNRANYSDVMHDTDYDCALTVQVQNKLTPRAIRWASPNFGTFLAHNGLKWSVRQILPPLETERERDYGMWKNVIYNLYYFSWFYQSNPNVNITCFM